MILTVDDHIYNLRAKTPEEAQSWHTMLQQTYKMCVQAYEFSAELKNLVVDIRATRALTELKPKLDAAITNCQRFGFCENDMEAALKTQVLVNKGAHTGTIDTTGLETSAAKARTRNTMHWACVHTLMLPCVHVRAYAGVHACRQRGNSARRSMRRRQRRRLRFSTPRKAQCSMRCQRTNDDTE